MAPITESVEIARSPEDVFAYLDDLARHGEWQSTIISARVDTEGPTRVGTRATETRRMGKREQAVTYEVTQHDPPRSFAFRGVDGPIRVVGKGSVEPVGDGTARASRSSSTSKGTGSASCSSRSPASRPASRSPRISNS